MKISLIIIIMTFILGCDQDPFGLSNRTIVGNYKLNQWEDGSTYYLNGPGKNEGYGALEGTVNKLGWNKQYILVFQNNNCCGSGWRIVNTASKTVSALIKNDDLKQHPEINGLIIYSAAQAWNKL